MQPVSIYLFILREKVFRHFNYDIENIFRTPIDFLTLWLRKHSYLQQKRLWEKLQWRACWTYTHTRTWVLPGTTAVLYGQLLSCSAAEGRGNVTLYVLKVSVLSWAGRTTSIHSIRTRRLSVSYLLCQSRRRLRPRRPRGCQGRELGRVCEGGTHPPPPGEPWTGDNKDNRHDSKCKRCTCEETSFLRLSYKKLCKIPQSTAVWISACNFWLNYSFAIACSSLGTEFLTKMNVTGIALRELIFPPFLLSSMSVQALVTQNRNRNHVGVWRELHSMDSYGNHGQCPDDARVQFDSKRWY